MNNKHLINEDLSKLEKVLDEAKHDFANDVVTFCKTNIFKMGKFIRIYSDLMKHLNVIVNNDVQEALEMKDDDGKESFQSRLEDLIKNWNHFLEKVEQHVGLLEIFFNA